MSRSRHRYARSFTLEAEVSGEGKSLAGECQQQVVLTCRGPASDTFEEHRVAVRMPLVQFQECVPARGEGLGQMGL